MRGTKKRMMYKKRKVGRRRFTRKMRGGYINYFTKENYETLSDNQRNKYNEILNDDFQRWYAIRQQENKNSSYKKLSRGFRGIFKSETSENLETKFLNSPIGQEKLAEISSIINTQNYIKKKEEHLQEEIKNEERLQEEIKEKEKEIKDFNDQLLQLNRSGFKNKVNLVTSTKIKSIKNNISELDRELKILLEKYSKNKSIEFTPKDDDDDDDEEDEEPKGGKRRRTKRRKH